jgi:hypothetical protein
MCERPHTSDRRILLSLAYKPKEIAMKRILNSSSAPRTGAGRALLVAIAALLSIWASAGSASAEEGRCAARNDLSQGLEERYAEVPVAVGLVDSKTIIEIFARADGDTWTIVTSRADGMSCVLGAGKAWQLLPIKPLGPIS